MSASASAIGGCVVVRAQASAMGWRDHMTATLRAIDDDDEMAVIVIASMIVREIAAGRDWNLLGGGDGGGRRDCG